MSNGIRLERYRHYRGGLYDVIALATDVETGEEMVVYRAVEGERKVWTRKSSVFVEKVTEDGKSRPRFALYSATPAREKTP